ncbi:hypothetical protein ACIRBY_32085 [Streptomyces sp. NPDC096136]|uniref:hypothetical protein n=1 Tax=Streptomyces sp. NPDC096136 TaxID=3366076 RepID=UPI003829CCA1
MIKVEQLRQPAVRRFVDSLNARDEKAFAEAVAGQFAYTCGEEAGGAAEFFTAHTRFVVTEQSEDGHTLTGVMSKSGEVVPAQWTLVPRAFKDVFKVVVATDIEFPQGAFGEALFHIDSPEGGVRTPEGTLRRMELGSHSYVHSWTRGALGKFDWINTGTKADADVYKSFHSPADGDQVDKVTSSKVTSRLAVDLGWDGGYQQATVHFHAKPYYAEPLAWREEHMRMVDGSVPTITATLTLTGPPTLTAPDRKAVHTEQITVKGTMPPYLLDFTRTFPLNGLPLGTYTLTLADAVKTGGYRSSTANTAVRLKDHTIDFRVGA